MLVKWGNNLMAMVSNAKDTQKYRAHVLEALQVH